MIIRFGNFTKDITSIYKSIQKIKRMEMDRIHLKGTHVMCINSLLDKPNGLTAAEISSVIREDKAGVSRALAQLAEMGYISYISGEGSDQKRKYRAKAILTESGIIYGQKMQNMITDAVRMNSSRIDESKREEFYAILGEIAVNLEHYVEKLEENRNNE